MPEQISKKVTIATLVASIIVLRLLIYVSVKDTGDPFITTLEPESLKTLNSQGTDPLISEVIDGSGLDMCSESKVEEFEVIKLPNVNNTYLCICSCPSADDQWNVIEECKLLASDTREFNGHPSKLFERCEDIESINRSKACVNTDTVESHNWTTKEGPDNKKNMLGIDVVFLKNNFWSFIYLLVMLLNGMINFIGPKLDIWIGVVATIVLGIEIPRHFKSAEPAFSWLYIPVLMYLTAYSLMLVSVILKCTSRTKWLSQVAVGAAFTCSTFSIIFSVIVSSLPSEYVCVFIGVLMVLAIFCVVHRVFLDVTIQRWMGEFTE